VFSYSNAGFSPERTLKGQKGGSKRDRAMLPSLARKRIAPIYELPGFHLGSNVTDDIARDFLHPLAEMIDCHQKTIRRYELVLHLPGKPPLDKDQIYESADLLVKLRNELVHYKSKGGQEMEGQKLFNRLKDLRFEKPSFVESNTNFFPHQLLGASCASWAVITATEFINAFYALLGFPSPLEPHKERLSVPPIRYWRGTAS
jgi:hypothetical protein